MDFQPTAYDHAFVVLALLLALPFGGWIGYQHYLKRHARLGHSALAREYGINYLWLGGLLAACILTCLLADRPLPPLFTTDAYPGHAWIGYCMAVGLAIGGSLRLVTVAVKPKAADQFAKAFEKLEAFLPRTRSQLALALGLSVAAGVAEEIAYRGYLIPYLAHWTPVWAAALISAPIFGLAHLYQGAAGVIGTTIVGLICAAIFLLTGHLWVPILLHAWIDITAMTTAYLVLKDRPLAS